MTDLTAAELDAICARLTKAQQQVFRREHLLNVMPTSRHDRTAVSLEKRGLLNYRRIAAAYGAWSLTPLGVATRKRLIERMNG